MAWYALPPSGNAVPIKSLLRRHEGDFAGAFAARAGLPRESVLSTSSGSGALWLGLRALRALEPRRRAVAVPAWCCPSVPRAVMQAGLDPVPIDMDPSSLGYDTSALLEARGRGLLAVVLVHFFGMAQPKPPGDWDGAAFIRDCAQDFEHIPGDGLPCFYSFGRGKALNAGHGGALCLPPGPWLESARRLLETLPVSRERVLPKVLAINLLSEPHIYWALSRLPLGLGKTEWHDLELARISPDFDEAALACLEAYESRRDYYRRLISGYRALFAACDGDWIAVPAGAAENWLPARFPVLVRDARLRETLFAAVDGNFGGVTRMYPDVLGRLPGAPAGFAAGRSFPGAERVAGEILTLPVTAGLSGREDELLDGIADLLEAEGVLRGRIRAAAPEPETPDWVPVPDYLPLA
jgi:dTDP-4-amino-4,6-dideoxygalactose transaminase